MPRILGVDIPGDKRIEASLPYIYGIGLRTAKKILEQANIDPNLRAKSLTPEQLGEIVHAINASGLLIEGDLQAGYPRKPEAFAGDSVLSGNSPHSRSSRPRSKNFDQRSYSEGPAEDCRRAAQ